MKIYNVFVYTRNQPSVYIGSFSTKEKAEAYIEGFFKLNLLKLAPGQELYVQEDWVK